MGAWHPLRQHDINTSPSSALRPGNPLHGGSWRKPDLLCDGIGGAQVRQNGRHFVDEAEQSDFTTGIALLQRTSERADRPRGACRHDRAPSPARRPKPG